MLETKLRLTITAILAIVNVFVLFGLSITVEQLAGINTALIACAAAVLAWFSPRVPIGRKA